VTRKNRK